MNYRKKLIKIYFITYILVILLIIIFHQPFVFVTLCIPVFGIIWYIYMFSFHEQVFEYTRKYNRKFHEQYSPEEGKNFVYGGLSSIFIPIKDINTIDDITIREKMKFIKFSFGIFICSLFLIILSVIIVVII